MSHGIEDDDDSDEIPYQGVLYYRSPTDYYFCLHCKVIGPKVELSSNVEIPSGYVYCLPIPDQSDGEFYDEIIQVRLP